MPEPHRRFGSAVPGSLLSGRTPGWRTRLRVSAAAGLAAAGALLGPPALAQAAETSGFRKVFVRNCAPCHGEDGRARTPAARKLGVKDLTQSRITDEQIRQQILDGVAGQSGTAKMPAFRGKLSEGELAGLVEIVRKLRR